MAFQNNCNQHLQFALPFRDERDLFELTGRTCLDGENEDSGTTDGFAGCEDWIVLTGIIAPLDEGPKFATSGDGLNLTNPTLGRGLTGSRVSRDSVTSLGACVE